jgi:hypothetical protein
VRRTLLFWASAPGAALAFAALVPLLFPFRALGLDPAADRPRIWLLTVFCAGVMALLFGISGMLGGRFLGLRDVLEHRSATIAIERERTARDGSRARGRMNPGVWTVTAGATLIAIYFVLLAVL